MAQPTPVIDRDVRPIFFDERQMTPPTNQYVCWLDVMGSRSIMSRSIPIAANFVMKLHVAVLETGESYPSIELYPMVDGVYLCGEVLADIFSFVKDVFSHLAVTFTEENNPLYRFIVKGGLSYGPVVRQADFLNCSVVLTRYPEYCERILLGIAPSQAFDREKEAPPFGIKMDDSVVAFGRIGNRPVSGIFWKWWMWNMTDVDLGLVTQLKSDLERYYGWCIEHSSTIGYKLDRIAEHKNLAIGYFSEETDWPTE